VACEAGRRSALHTSHPSGATEAGRREAINGVERITQGRDHKIVSKDSFGNESKTRDTER